MNITYRWKTEGLKIPDAQILIPIAIAEIELEKSRYSGTGEHHVTTQLKDELDEIIEHLQSTLLPLPHIARPKARVKFNAKLNPFVERAILSLA